MTQIETDPLFLDFQASVAGRYSLERELGRGGMGIVYLARDVRLDRRVAIKLLPPHLAGNAEFRRRFLDEARMAARLSHPNIVTVHTVEDAGPFAWFVLAYIEGETLASRVRREGHLPVPAAMRILREVAWALGHAHGHGIVHRDIKPENILLEAGSGRALVADFGIAGAIEASGGEPPGRVMGTVQYMSPEQAAGERVDGRSDLYSLGVLAHYMLTGRPPFDGNTAAEVMARHLTETAPALQALAPHLPRPVGQAVDGLLAKDREERIQSADTLADVLSRSIEQRAGVPEPVRRFVALTESAPALRVLAATLTTGILVTYAIDLAWLEILSTRPLWKSVIVEVLRFASIGASLLLPPWITVRRLRRLQAAGHDRQETVRALAEDDADFQGINPPPATIRRWKLVHGGWLGSVATLTATGLLMLLNPTLPDAMANATIIAFAASAGAAVMGSGPGIEAGIRLGRRHRFWESRLGGLLFRLARLGRSAPPTPVAGAGATEIALGHAALALYEALTPDLQAEVADLPALVRRLEGEAGELRRFLDAPLAEAGRARAQDRLATVVGALETLRLDLLRLRSGTLPLDNLTADLEAVQRVSEAADRHLAAREEVRAALNPSPPPATAP